MFEKFFKAGDLKQPNEPVNVAVFADFGYSTQSASLFPEWLTQFVTQINNCEDVPSFGNAAYDFVWRKGNIICFNGVVDTEYQVKGPDDRDDNGLFVPGEISTDVGPLWHSYVIIAEQNANPVACRYFDAAIAGLEGEQLAKLGFGGLGCRPTYVLFMMQPDGGIIVREISATEPNPQSARERFMNMVRAQADENFFSPCQPKKQETPAES